MIFSPYFRPNHLDGSLFFGGGSKSETKTTSSTSSMVNDNRVAASEGSISAGQGANVTVQTLDANLAEASLREVGNISNDAVKAVSDSAIYLTGAAKSIAADATQKVSDTAGRAIDSNTDVSRDAISAGSKLASDTLNFRADETTAALDFAKTSQQSTNDLIRYTNEAFTAKLASNAGDAPQETVKQIIKYGALVAAVYFGFRIFKKN